MKLCILVFPGERFVIAFIAYQYLMLYTFPIRYLNNNSVDYVLQDICILKTRYTAKQFDAIVVRQDN